VFRIYSARAYRAVRERLGLVTATLAEDISGMRVVQAFRRERANEKNFHAVNAHYRQANQQTVVLNGLYFPFVDFLSALATAIVLGYGGHLVFGGDLTVGTLFAFVLYLSNFFDPVQQLSQLYNTFLSAVAALDNIMNVMDEEPEVRDKGAAQELDRIEGHVRFEGVRFGYETDREILRGIDLEVKPGTMTAVVGPSGAGKSTLSRLLFRFYEPTAGRITIDGQDIGRVTQASLRAALGIVPQDTVLFNDTIGYNIGYGREGATGDEIVAAAKGAAIHDFVMELPAGYESMVGERGLKLSGGEKQRVAIARTLLKDPPILILDEATSALDSRTEAAIQETLKGVAARRTSIVIAHRLSTVVDADQIVVLDQGRVAERGTHAQLLRKNGLYADMWARQQSEREEEEAQAAE